MSRGAGIVLLLVLAVVAVLSWSNWQMIWGRDSQISATPTIFGISPTAILAPPCDKDKSDIEVAGISAGFSFDRNFGYGHSGREVWYLQIILNSDPDTRLREEGHGSPGCETWDFGYYTMKAVERFQEKYKAEILSSQGIDSATGWVGPYTRAQLNSILAAARPQRP